MNTEEQVTFGLPRKIAYLIIWLTSWIGGVVFFFLEREDRGVRKNAMQSMILGGVLTALIIVINIFTIIPFLGVVFNIISRIARIAYLAITITCAVQAFSGKEVHLPVIGDIAEKYI